MPYTSRRCHYIKPNKTSETPQRAIWLALDIYVLCKSQGRTVYEFDSAHCVFGVRDSQTSAWCLSRNNFTTSGDLWLWMDSVTRAKTKTYLLTTDSSRVLTLLDMFRQSYDHHWKCTLAVLGKYATIVRWRKDAKTLLLLDMLNIWQMPSLSISTGASAKPLCVSDSATKPCARENEIESYVNGMVKTTLEWWNFLKTNDLGGFSPTIGAQSMRTWRHKYMTDKILIDCHDDALKLARDGLYGGRNECYVIGSRQGQFFQLDINSSYAAVMYSTRMPVQLRGYSEHATVGELHTLVINSVCIADVVVKTNIQLYPVRDNHQLFFPVGRFRTVLSGAELELALARGHVERVYRVAAYDAAYAFTNYMESLWLQRRAAQALGLNEEAERWKLLMASFFGKWSQRGRRWENVDEAENGDVHYWIDIDADTGEVCEYRQFSGIIQKCVYDPESSDSFPAISACVTAAARLSLWSLIEQAGVENVYYVDTDSLLVNTVGNWRLHQHIDADRLGGLRCVGEYSDIQIYGPKFYRLGNVSRHAGVCAAALYTDPRYIVQNESVSYSESLRLGTTARAISYDVSKAYEKAYTKGRVAEDGKVTPIQLDIHF